MFSLPRPTFILLALIFGGLVSLGTLKFQTDIWPLLPPHLPSVRGLQTAQNLLPSGRDVIVVLAPETKLTPEEKNQWLSVCTEQLSALPAVESVHRLGSFDPATLAGLTAWIVAQLPEKDFADLQRELTTPKIKERLQASLLRLTGAVQPEEVALLSYDPLRLTEWLAQRGYSLPALSISPSTAPTALAVRARASLHRWDECQAFIHTIRAALKTSPPFLLTGRPAFTAEISAQMRTDMILMVTVAVFLTSGAFWLVYRSMQPLLWILLAQLTAVLGGLIAARLCFGELNLLSIGFASILLGVGLDYCILVYHHFARGLNRISPMWKTLRRGIWLSAVTTAGSFAVLAFSSFPGLQQLALLVGVGLLLIAWLATDWLPSHLEPRAFTVPLWINPRSREAGRWLTRHRTLLLRLGLFGSASLAGGLFVLRPTLYQTDLQTMQPRNLEAYRGQALLAASPHDGVLMTGSSWSDLRQQASHLRTHNALAQPIQQLLLPSDSSEVNRSHWLPGRSLTFQQAAHDGGLEPEWQQATADWLLRLDLWSENSKTLHLPSPWSDFFTKNDRQVVALFLIREGTIFPLRHGFGGPDGSSVWPVSWDILKQELGQTARHDFLTLSLGLLLVVVGLCVWAHRSAFLVGLNLLTLATALLLFAALLTLGHVSLTVLSLLAIPLLIGLVIDYSLHFTLALEEQDGDIAAAYEHLAAPILLTGFAAMIGFGAPLLTRQPLLQNFGLVMDLGLLSAVVTTLLFLPVWYRPPRRAPHYSRALYQASWFERGALLGKYLPRPLLQALGQSVGWLYGLTRRRTQSALRDNLSLLRSDLTPANVQRVFTHYGAIFADYFHLGYLTRDGILALAEDRWGYDHLKAAHAAGRGAVLVTGHFGFFEFGGAIGHALGFPTTALTLPEHSPALTEWRAAWRKRWGVETLQIGQDPFAYVAVLNHLRAGRFIAILADRPPDQHAISIPLPHGSIPFSTGPATLAVMAECPLIPIMVIRKANGHYRLQAHAPLQARDHGATHAEQIDNLTREVARALVPTLCEYPEQWYQFLPLRSSRP